MRPTYEVMFSWDRERVCMSVTAEGKPVFSDRVDPVSAPSRSLAMERLRKALPSVSAETLAEFDRRLVAEIANKPKPQQHQEGPTDADLLQQRDQQSDAKLAAMPEDIRAEADALLRDPGLVQRIVHDVASLGVAGEETLTLMIYVLATSRLLKQPLAACTQGGTSTGKSFVAEQVAKLMPSGHALLATDMTQNSLYYLEPGGLMHTFVAAGERQRREDDDTADRTRALREIISTGELRKLVPEKDGDRNVTRIVRSPGPIAYYESTTLPELFGEDANRMLLLGTDDSPEQTRRILDAAATRAAGASVTADVQRIIDVHHAAQRILRRVEVRVPFAAALLGAMPADRPEARRAAGHVLGVVRAVALLHQFQRADGRDLAHGDAIDATLQDYAIARDLLMDPLGRTLGGGLPAHTAAFGEWLLRAIPAGIMFEAPGALLKRVGCRWGRSQVAEHVRRLVGAGTVERTGHGEYRIIGPLPLGGATWLPVLEGAPSHLLAGRPDDGEFLSNGAASTVRTPDRTPTGRSDGDREASGPSGAVRCADRTMNPSNGAGFCPSSGPSGQEAGGDPLQRLHYHVENMAAELDGTWPHPFGAGELREFYAAMAKAKGIDAALADAEVRYQQHVAGTYPPLEVR